MSEAYEKIKAELSKNPKKWLVTGAAGFIGSHIMEELLSLGQEVTALDNLSTGYEKNIHDVLKLFPNEKTKNFSFIKGDVCDLTTCEKALSGVDYVLHQAAIGSVPRSIIEPLVSFHSNVTGFNNIIFAAKNAKVKRFVYASSSSVYGDDPTLPKKEDNLGNLLSPYALSKYENELTAEVFARCYGMETIGLRYFNVFGARQDPNGSYAAVIPLWTKELMKNGILYINGDGETSRDFCYVKNVVQANILAATAQNSKAVNRAYNVSCGNKTSLNELYAFLKEGLLADFSVLATHKPSYRGFRDGDIRHSMADIDAIQNALGYSPTHQVKEGIALAIDWYKKNL